MFTLTVVQAGHRSSPSLLPLFLGYSFQHKLPNILVNFGLPMSVSFYSSQQLPNFSWRISVSLLNHILCLTFPAQDHMAECSKEAILLWEAANATLSAHAKTTTTGSTWTEDQSEKNNELLEELGRVRQKLSGRWGGGDFDMWEKQVLYS